MNAFTDGCGSPPGKEITRVDRKRFCNRDQREHRHVLLATLDRPDIGAVHSCQLSKLLLRPAVRTAMMPNSCAEIGQDIITLVSLHGGASQRR